MRSACLGTVSELFTISAKHLVRSRSHRKLGRGGKSGDVGATQSVDGNRVGPSRGVVVKGAAANISGVDQLRACRVNLATKPVCACVLFTAEWRFCTGKSVRRMYPVTYTFPDESTAIPCVGLVA